MKNKKKIIDRLLPVAALILAVSVLLSSCSLSSAVGALGGKDSGTGKTPTGDTVVNNNQITVMKILQFMLNRVQLLLWLLILASVCLMQHTEAGK